jgi:hypothetical protein
MLAETFICKINHYYCTVHKSIRNRKVKYLLCNKFGC